MQRSCKITIGVFMVLGAMALAFVPLAQSGFLGLQPDPRNGVFAVLLATPWFWLFDSMLGEQAGGFGMLMAAAGIGINAGVIGILCSKFGARDDD
ncbi:MAG: hypothetical protein KDJ55_09465 [Rhodobiaceae bacterium]|nr:hypothetical protein [Rhodobiaceae bacterium]MCC0012303.1 hypothetical protein [Rhodobiaceae bacterium]MCC0060782.1 hypothetical protein [Rhodobiaceae bacterium]